MDSSLRHDWNLAEVREIHDQPFNDLIFRAQQLHRRYHRGNAVQLCSLLSIKTGACSEDCGYCSQSAHYASGTAREALMDVDAVVASARAAQEAGASRFCMGAAWRGVKDGEEFDNVCEMIRGITELGMETCVTLGMLDRGQAERLKQAGLKAYNHNIDTSRDYYPEVVSTHSFDERIETLRHIREAGITICSGGIIGMWESVGDRCKMLIELANLPKHPESVPVNALVPIKGTPMADLPAVRPFELARVIACARIMMPASMVRLSAGRRSLSDEAQALCFLAGANSIFYGERLLTTGNAEVDRDRELMAELGIEPLVPVAGHPTPAERDSDSKGVCASEAATAGSNGEGLGNKPGQSSPANAGTNGLTAAEA